MDRAAQAILFRQRSRQSISSASFRQAQEWAMLLIREKESSGSQFYIVTGDASHLDGQYTVYGKVTKGMDIAYK